MRFLVLLDMKENDTSGLFYLGDVCLICQIKKVEHFRINFST